MADSNSVVKGGDTASTLTKPDTPAPQEASSESPETTNPAAPSPENHASPPIEHRSSLQAIYGENPVIAHSTDDYEHEAHGTMGGPNDRHQQGGADVIEVYNDDHQEEAPVAPTIPPSQAAVLAGCIVVVVLFPFVFGSNARWVDFLGFLCFIPAICCFGYALTPRQRQNISPLTLWGKFSFGWLAVLPCVAFTVILGTIVGTFFLAVIFGLLHIRSNVAFGLVWTILFTAMVVISEELFKFAVMQVKDKLVENPRSFVFFSFYSALGLATGEAYFLVLFIRRMFDAVAITQAKMDAQTAHTTGAAHTLAPFSRVGGTYAPGGSTRLGSPDFNPDLAGADDTFYILLNCLMVIIPMHVLSGYHVGLGIARGEVLKEKLSAGTILVAPFFFRFFFLYTVLWLPLFTGMDWVSLTAIAMIPLYVAYVRRDEKRMPRSYLRRAGYLNAFGYGVIPEEDEAERGTDLGVTPPQDRPDPEAAV